MLRCMSPKLAQSGHDQGHLACPLRNAKADLAASAAEASTHQRPPCGTKKQSSTPVDLLMNRTGVWSGVSPSFIISGGTNG